MAEIVKVQIIHRDYKQINSVINADSAFTQLRKTSHVYCLTALEPRILTRWDMQKYARDAYNAGIRYIGGCCGFEPYHIRALSEELETERGFLPAGSEKHGSWGSGLMMHTKPWVRARCIFFFLYN